MTYKRFEDLPVWNDAVRLPKETFELSSTGTFRLMSGFKGQIERAAVSVSNNIVEGFERGTNGELLTFLYIAKGSVAEVRSMLCLLERLDPAPGLEKAVAGPKRLSESISQQLCGWIESIKDSGYGGNRSQNHETRQLREAARRRDDFLSALRDIQARAPQSRASTDIRPDPDPSDPPP